MSRLRQVVTCVDSLEALVVDEDGNDGHVSLLALDGPAPRPGDWLVVHSGYAVGRLDDTTARATLAELEAARQAAGQPADEEEEAGVER